MFQARRTVIVAQGWRGFGKERHAALKAWLAAVALAGFAGGWLGFASSHPPLEEPVTEATTTLAPTSAIPTGTATPSSGAAATPAIAANPTEPLPTYPRPKRSRGS